MAGNPYIRRTLRRRLSVIYPLVNGQKSKGRVRLGLAAELGVRQPAKRPYRVSRRVGLVHLKPPELRKPAVKVRLGFIVSFMTIDKPRVKLG